jgi:hypothetical protein
MTESWPVPVLTSNDKHLSPDGPTICPVAERMAIPEGGGETWEDIMYVVPMAVGVNPDFTNGPVPDCTSDTTFSLCVSS